jgi:hypothetical protein
MRDIWPVALKSKLSFIGQILKYGLNIIFTVHVYQYNFTIHQHMHVTIKINTLLKSPTYVSVG